MPDQAEIRISASTPRPSPNIAAYRGSAAASGADRNRLAVRDALLAPLKGGLIVVAAVAGSNPVSHPS
jgi:hypothetical protein